MEMISMMITAGLLAGAVYQLVNICMSTPTEAVLEGYSESTYYDPDLGTENTSFSPVYSYEYRGFRRTFQSRFGALPFLRKRLHKIYVRRDGKAFEMEGFLFCVATAALVFFLR